MTIRLINLEDAWSWFQTNHGRIFLLTKNPQTDSRQMEQLTFEKLEQKYKELKNRSFSDPLPQSAVEWEKFIHNPILDKLPVGIALLDNDYQLQGCNKQYASYLSSSPFGIKGARGKSIFEYLPGIQYTAGEVLKDTKNSGKIKIEIEREICLKLQEGDLHTYWDANLIALIDKHKNSSGIVIFCLDKTEEVRSGRLEIPRQKTIEDLKTTIRVVNELRVEEKNGLHENVYYTTSNIIMPLIDRLKQSNLDAAQKSLIELIENNLQQIASSFSSTLAGPQFDLTAKEILIAGLIREGRSTKEIADILHVSSATIDFHRNNIRKKIGIKNRSISLQSYFASLK